MKRNATRRLLTALLAAAMCLSMAACGSKPAADNGSSDTDASAGDDAARKYTIGVCQLVTHDALDAATQGFKDALTEKLGEGNVKFDEQNASGDSANCTTIVSGFVSTGVDLILANATAPLQAAAQATADIPVLGTSITDYATALDISDWTSISAETYCELSAAKSVSMSILEPSISEPTISRDAKSAEIYAPRRRSCSARGPMGRRSRPGSPTMCTW